MALLPKESILAQFRRSGSVTLLAAALWAITLTVIFIRAAHRPKKHTVLTTYVQGGQRWLDSANLYKGKRGFVYSPATAAFFVPVALLPTTPANILWRLLNAGTLLGAMAWWLSLNARPSAKTGSGFYRGIPQYPHPLHALAFILLLPLSIGNLNNGQVNPLLIGLLMVAIAACHRERWTLAAFCVALAAYFKIYPLAIGLLLCAAFPRKFTWRLFAALIALGALSLVLQKPAYVLEQYRLWFATRAADNRFLYSDSIAPRDLWMLFRLFHIPVTQHVYMAIQVLSGAAIGLIVWIGRRQSWEEDRLLAALFSLGCGWMLLCGPATESATYVMLAPAVVLAFVQAFSRPLPTAMRVWIATVLVILLIALGMNSFLKLKKTVYTMSVQPFAALLFVGYGLALTRRAFWPAEAANDRATNSHALEKFTSGEAHTPAV